MYGTVARLRPRSGQVDELLRLSDEWRKEIGSKTDGFVGEYVFKLDENPDEYILVALFRDREAYRANAEKPEQHEWYLRMRETLESDPEWNDGEVVYSS